MSPLQALVLVCAFAAFVSLLAWAVCALRLLRTSQTPALLLGCSAGCALLSVVLYPGISTVVSAFELVGWRESQNVSNLTSILALALRAAAGLLLGAALWRLEPKTEDG